MKLIVLGLSLSSSWGNGHATTYRALLKGFASRGHDILFLERDVPWYRNNRDIADPEYCRLELYCSLEELRHWSGDIRNADAVIVNPEHYAVAVKYDEKRAEAPFVVAKGVDEMALYIRELAGQHAIPIVPLPPLARAIYNTSQVNQQIPAALYKAVAQVLHYVLQLKAFQSGRRPAQPHLPDVNVPSHLT